MHIATIVRRVTALRKEKRGIANLLAAVREANQQSVRVYGGHVDTMPELPTVHPYSEIWNLVELDPNRWH